VRIGSIFPDEVERYLSIAPAGLRDEVSRQREETEVSQSYTGGQASLPWLFTRPTFRRLFINSMIEIAERVTSFEEGVQVVADNMFKFDVLRTILAEEGQ
jgi:hypothetical protein